MADKKLKIGLMGLSGKPVPPPKNLVNAPNEMVALLANEFKKLGYVPIVFTTKESTLKLKHPFQYSSPNIEYDLRKIGQAKYVYRRAEFDLILSTEAIKSYKKGEIDLINSHDVRLNPYLFYQAGVPVLYTVHGDMQYGATPYDFYKYRLIKQMKSGFLNISSRNVNFCQKNGLPEYGLVPNAVDPDLYAFNKENRNGFLVVSRLTPIKKIELAVKVALRLKQPITIIGPQGTDKTDREYYNFLSKKYFNLPGVNYIGHLERKKIIPYYQRAGVLLYTSIAEGLPVAILEAMSTGLPVVASDVGGVPDIITPGVDGYIVTNQKISNWTEKVKKALNIRSIKCREKIISKFSPEIMAKKYLKGYNKFLAQC